MVRYKLHAIIPVTSSYILMIGDFNSQTGVVVYVVYMLFAVV